MKNPISVTFPLDVLAKLLNSEHQGQADPKHLIPLVIELVEREGGTVEAVNGDTYTGDPNSYR